MTKTFILFGLFIFGMFLNSFSQQDFNNYQTLISRGDVPKDFLDKSSFKVEQNLENNNSDLSPSQAKVFYESINYGLDDLLHSGLVMYGDEISEYVNRVADNLLKNDRKLRKQLRFYTLKSNVTNALSTNQGIILVTTGLISQLTNEAQLACILAHEISHFTEDHVIDAFEYRNENRRIRDKLAQLTNYSKEKEFEADYKGIELYNEAGYSSEPISSVFDVLMYSYLPINEIEFPITYFNTEHCYIPESRFTNKRYEIKAKEDYDDSKSTHPNIRKRKEQAVEAISEIRKWGDKVFFLPEDDFYYVRNLARFESIRTDLLEAQYGNALYTIFLLEREYPNSIYLMRMKSQCWLGLMAYKSVRDISETVKSKSEWEGESARVHAFIRKLKNEELESLAMRVIEDARKAFPEDKEINAIWRSAVDYLVRNERFELSNYSEYTFQEAYRRFEAKNQALDTTEVVEVKEAELSKYERIKNKRNFSNPENFDSSYYYRYNLSDLVQSDLFLEQYDEIQDQIKDEEALEERIDQMTPKEYKKYRKENPEFQTDLNSFVLVEPFGIHYTRSGKLKYQKSELLQDRFREASIQAAERLDYKVISISKNDIANQGSKAFNDKCVFTSFLQQVTLNEDLNVFPVDYSRLNELKDDYGTNKLVFSIVEHNYAPNLNSSDLYLIFVPMILPYRIMNSFMKGNYTEINLIVLDIEKAEVETGINRVMMDPPSAISLQAYMMDILNELNTK